MTNCDSAQKLGGGGGHLIIPLNHQLLTTRSPIRVLSTTSLTTDSRSDHVRRPVARPLWIPAFAGMTEVMHSTYPGSSKPNSRFFNVSLNHLVIHSRQREMVGDGGLEPPTSCV